LEGGFSRTEHRLTIIGDNLAAMIGAPGAAASSQCAEERYQVLPLPIGKNEVEAPLIVADHVLEAGRDSVMEVRRSGGQGPQQPEIGDVRRSEVGSV